MVLSDSHGQGNAVTQFIEKHQVKVAGRFPASTGFCLRATGCLEPAVAIESFQYRTNRKAVSVQDAHRLLKEAVGQMWYRFPTSENTG